MKRKTAKKKIAQKSKVSLVGKLIFVLGVYNIVGAIYLISISPQNLTKKASVFKKTYIVSSQKKCDGPAVVNATEKLQIPILLYHYVEFVKDKKDTIRQSLNLNPEIFESQVKNLVDNKYQTVFVKDIPDLIRNESPQCDKMVALTFDDGYEDFYLNVFPLLKKYNVKATVYIITNLIDKPDFLSESQIRELIESGLVEIGSHTLDHLDLSKIPDDVGRNQITESKKALEHKFNISVKSFAYPYGKFVPADVEFVKEASYSAAVTVAESSYHTKGNELILGRIRPGKYIGQDIGKELELASK